MSETKLTSKTVSTKLGKWLSTSLDKCAELQEDAGYIEDFSSWVSEQAAFQTKNSKLQPAIYILTNFAILETAQHVFSIGSGFTSLDMTGFTLAQILKTVQRIEAKVDTMLKEPLNSAIDYFNTAMSEIENDSYDDAYKSFKDVIENATKAFHYVSGKKVDIQSFQEYVKAIQLLIISRISRYSYDKDKKCFLPFPTLPSNKVKLIGDFLEDLVKKSLSQKTNVKTKFFSFNSQSEQKEKIQDILDQILKICYSYISQNRGWTNMRTKINPAEKKFSMTVMPQYLPEGVVDAAEVIFGVKTGDYQPSSVSL